MDDTSAAFEAHVGPLRRSLIALLGAAEELRQRWGSLPDVKSRAMAEIASENEYVAPSPWGDEPIRQAHNLGQLLLVSFDDSARAACRLLEGEKSPIFAHVVLARSALEHAGRAWWLLDPGISTRERVARGFNERLNSLHEQSRLPVDIGTRRRARDRIRGILQEGESVGFHKARAKRGQSAFIERARPSATKLMGYLLDDGEDEHLGKVIYSYYSAVTHGTGFGLTQSVDRDMVKAPAGMTVKQAALFTSSQAVCMVLSGLILGSGKAFRARNDLFSWDSPEWAKATLTAYRSARESLGFTE